MKKATLFFLILLSVVFRGRSQDYHPSTAVEMNDYLQQLVAESEKDNWTVIRAECGIFSMQPAVVDYGVRTLIPGHVYTIKIFTDKMIPDFKLVLWRVNDANTYERVDSSNNNELVAKNIQAPLLGDMEIVTVTPTVAREYAFQIVSMTTRNRTGHFGLMILEREIGRSSSMSNNNNAVNQSGAYRRITRNSGYKQPVAEKGTEHVIKTGSYEWAYLKENMFTHRETADGTWQSASERGLFTVNEGQRTIEQLEPAKLKGTYRIDNVSRQGRVVTYETTHVATGTPCTIVVDLNTSMLKIRSTSNKRPYMIMYYISQIS